MHGESWRVVDPYSHGRREGKSSSAAFNGALYGSIFHGSTAQIMMQHLIEMFALNRVRYH